MAYKFQSELAYWLKEKSISRKDFIARLQQERYEVFKGLDAITLSRWLNGWATPPLYKQLYIARTLGVDLIEVILNISENDYKPSIRYTSIVLNLIHAFDFSLTGFSYYKVSGTIKSEIRTQTYFEHIDMLKDFYGNLSAIKKFIDDLYSMKTDIKYECILLKNENDDVVGHWVGVIDLNKLNNLRSFINIPENEVGRSCLIQLGRAINSAHFFELIIQAACYYLLSLINKKDYVYIFISGSPILEFTTKILRAEVVKYYPPVERHSNMGIYLVKIDIIRAISNPILILKIKKKLKCLQSCYSLDCKSCNLKDYRQSRNQLIGLQQG